MDTAHVRVSRGYRSKRRAGQARFTRGRVIESAAAMFLARGYAGTTIRSVAAGAGVSVPTVELLFGTKASLLKAAIDVAIAGDDQAVPVLQRDWTVEALRCRNGEEFLAVAARVIAAAQARSAGLVLAVFEGAIGDPELAELSDQMSSQRAGTAAWLVDALSGRAALRPQDTLREAVDTLWVLMDPALFVRLVHQLHWTTDQYCSWFARSARRMLIVDDPGQETP
ncbi:MAG: TetR/AcrR family transcriptional regulator [Actinomycetota bacterium]|nr:TetR/AcrR family transcriptional regulator [Actinomycetota bacterium]